VVGLLGARDVGDVALSYDGHLGRGAERRAERDAVEVLADVAAADRRHVEDDDKDDDDDDAEHEADDDADQLEAPIDHVERDERHQSERQQEAEHEAGHVRVVVDHRQQADDEQRQHVAGQLEDLPARTSNDVPVVDHLDEQARQDAKLRPGRTRLATYVHTYTRILFAQNDMAYKQ